MMMPKAWAAMIDHTRRAEQDTGRSCKVMMDLGGPKIRTGPVLMPPDQKRLYRGDHILLSRSAPDLANAEEAEHPPRPRPKPPATIPEDSGSAFGGCAGLHRRRQDSHSGRGYGTIPCPMGKRACYCGSPMPGPRAKN